MKKLLYLLILGPVLIINSCVESAGFEFPESGTQLVVMSTFSPDQNISVSLSTSISPCCTSEVTFPDNAKIELFEQGSLIGVLANDKINNRYVMVPPHLPNEKLSYDIHIELPDQNISNISAHSYIPPKNSIQSVKVLSLDSTGTSKYVYEFDIQIELSTPEMLDAYFHVVPSYQTNFLSIDPHTGNPIVNYTGEIENLKIEKLLSNQNATHILNHDTGVLVEYAKLNDNIVQLKLRTRPIQTDMEVFQKVQIDLQSVTKEYFKYHKAISQSSSSNGGVVPKPINIPSNIQNGQGLFSGVNSWKSSFHIR